MGTFPPKKAIANDPICFQGRIISTAPGNLVRERFFNKIQNSFVVRGPADPGVNDKLAAELPRVRSGLPSIRAIWVRANEFQP